MEPGVLSFWSTL